MVDEFQSALVIFVGGYCELYACSMQLCQCFRDALVGAGVNSFMGLVVCEEVLEEAVDVVRLSGVFRKGAFNEQAKALGNFAEDE